MCQGGSHDLSHDMATIAGYSPQSIALRPFSVRSQSLSNTVSGPHPVCVGGYQAPPTAPAHLPQGLLDQLILQVLLDMPRGLVQDLVILRGEIQLAELEPSQHVVLAGGVRRDAHVRVCDVECQLLTCSSRKGFAISTTRHQGDLCTRYPTRVRSGQPHPFHKMEQTAVVTCLLLVLCLSASSLRDSDTLASSSFLL